MMNCYRCRQKTKVIDTNINKKTGFTARRRECLECGSRFTTYEIAREDYLYLQSQTNEALGKRIVEMDKAVNKISAVALSVIRKHGKQWAEDEVQQ